MNDNLFAMSATPSTQKISSKTDALTYAISVTRTADGIHLDKAEQVFRMFLDNINLPDIADESQNNFYAQATKTMEALNEQIKELVFKTLEKEKAEATDEKGADTRPE